MQSTVGDLGMNDGGSVRVVDQLIEYACERGMLNADQVKQLEATGFIKRRYSLADGPADGRWTERYWEGFDPTVEVETGEVDIILGVGHDQAGEGMTRATRSGRRSQGARRGRKWTSRRARQVRRALARAWRQPGAGGGKAA